MRPSTALTVLLTLLSLALGEEEKPIIGILTLPLSASLARATQASDNVTAYFPASYVKYVESAGARVVPIIHTRPSAEISDLLNRLNGVLLTGGGDIQEHSEYFSAVKMIIDRATTKTTKTAPGLPVWGTCLGMEMLIQKISGNFSILTAFDSENLPSKVRFPLDPLKSSTMFSGKVRGADDVVRSLGEYATTFNNHQWGISPTDFARHESLSRFFRIVGTSVDRKDREFVAIIEGLEYPVFGVQFHPEKPVFEWTDKLVIPHDRRARDVGQYLADVFVDRASLWQPINPFLYQDSLNFLVGNFLRVFTAKSSSFEEVYLF